MVRIDHTAADTHGNVANEVGAGPGYGVTQLTATLMQFNFNECDWTMTR